MTFYSNSFSDACRELLITKMKDVGIRAVARKCDGSLAVSTSGVRCLFKMIGRKSPVSCYSYKFNVPDYVFKMRSPEVQEKLGISKRQLHLLIQRTGMRNEFGEKHRFFYFDDDQVERLKNAKGL